jgi:hypothetical protein
MKKTAEHQRLTAHKDRKANWKHWGPYLSERAWGTVREDYSENGNAWEYFPHDQARSRAYRWNEDGLAGISDRNQYLCFAIAIWNGRDPILKERLFGLAGSEGNHGEDVKEYYFYLDSTPTHSYMKMLYKYPQATFPYGELVAENLHRGYHDFEYELLDTGVFVDNRYFDISVEYAKAAENDILIQISVVNRGPETAEITLLPTLWFRNTWSWGYDNGPMDEVSGKPILKQRNDTVVAAVHPKLGTYYLFAENPSDLLFTENETNQSHIYGISHAEPYAKDAFHRYLVDGEAEAVNPAREGTKTAAFYPLSIPAGETAVVRLRLNEDEMDVDPFDDFNTILQQRVNEADEFYSTIQLESLSDDEKRVQRQAWAGMLWSKQLYYYDVAQWLQGDPATPKTTVTRNNGRNNEWDHIHNFDIISMPDKWEYPWYAAWDLAFHCIPLVMVDPEFAKRQLVLMTREWYMHPNGQLPAYEWDFSDVNPPVHAWATWRVYKIDEKMNGVPDRAFLEGTFQKLLLNFTWWVNKKDEGNRNIFQGGFLGLDNISIFDRSKVLPSGGHLDQSDGTAWMGFFSLSMMRMALELARENPIYQDLATKFFEHFLAIATAMSQGFDGRGLWDEVDGFYYDVLHMPDDTIQPLKVRSLVGLIPLLAVEILDDDLMAEMPIFERRMRWFLKHRPHLSGNIAYSFDACKEETRHILGIVTTDHLKRILGYMLDEDEFLSPFGIRSLSKIHKKPYQVSFRGETFSINYEPAESQSGLFGGNSNWRGPIWFPINFLLIESLQKYHYYFGEDLKVEFPTGSSNMLNLWDVSVALSQRLTNLFLRNKNGKRPVYGGIRIFQEDPHWRDLILYNEYFHGDNGAGLGASHQTGWTGLVAKLIQQSGGSEEIR